MRRTGNSDNADVVGLQEYSSIAAGVLALDAMVKMAHISLLVAGTVCPGKYVVLFTGDVASVEASLAAGREAATGWLLDELYIPNLHRRVLPAIRGRAEIADWEALGIIECLSVAAGIEAADLAAKESDVQIPEIRLAYEMHGKSFVKVTGPVHDVQAAVEAGAGCAERRGLLLHRVVLANPHPEIRTIALRDRLEGAELWK